MLVVLQHSAGAYSIGENWLVVSPERVSFFKPFLTVNSTFFMGLFFFISAFFMPTSLLRYGRRAFVINKIKRLIIPAILGVLIVLPLAYYVQSYPDSFIHFYLNYVTSETINFGHMWFLIQLFIYSCFFALLYYLKKDSLLKQNNKPLTCLQGVSFILLLSLLTYFVGLVSPINQWFWQHLVEPYHLPQYISLFVLGIIAFQRDWLSSTTLKFGIYWLFIGVIGIIFQSILSSYDIKKNLLGSTLWTSLECISLCIGLLIIFRDYFNYSNKILQFLSNNAFAVYIIHVPIVVWTQHYLLQYPISPINKFFITSLFSYFIAYLLSCLLRQSKLVSSFI